MKKKIKHKRPDPCARIYPKEIIFAESFDNAEEDFREAAGAVLVKHGMKIQKDIIDSMFFSVDRRFPGFFEMRFAEDDDAWFCWSLRDVLTEVEDDCRMAWALELEDVANELRELIDCPQKTLEQIEDGE